MVNVFHRMKVAGATLATLLLVTACGGGGDSGLGIVGTGGTGISGSVIKGPVSNATVAAFAISGGQVGAQLGTTTTDANGNFSMAMSDYSGPVMIRTTGGSYRDEATGQPMSMGAADMMTAVVPSLTSGTTTTGIQVTALTGMAQTMAQQMTGGMTASNIAAANSAMGAYFGVSDVLHVSPMNPLVAGSGATATQDARTYGMTLAAMSQYAKTLGMSVSSGAVTAMMSDASDGVLDGKKAGAQISMSMGGMMGTSMMPATAGTTGMADAMTAFANSTANVSGITATQMASLIQRIGTSSGAL